MRRRNWLGSLGAGFAFLLSGCLGSAPTEQSELTFDRPTTNDVQCHEIDLVDDSYRLYPRISPLGDTGVSWPVELEENDVIRIGIFWWGERNRVLPLPEIRVTDPRSTAILELSDYSSNHHTAVVEHSGTHEIEMTNQDFSEGGRWKITITWHPSRDCI